MDSNAPKKNKALIILNSKYTSDRYGDLSKNISKESGKCYIEEDGDMMEELLYDYERTTHPNVKCLLTETKEFIENIKDQDIDRLHFHFSGHGVNNALLKLNAVEEEGLTQDEKTSETKTTKTPNGDCLVNTDGTLVSVHDIKLQLLDSTATKVTVTLDCCRTEQRRGPTDFVLRRRGEISSANQKRIAVFVGAGTDGYVIDKDSFTKALHKVHKGGGLSIPIDDITSRVNDLWQNTNRVCSLEITKTNKMPDSWNSYLWPSKTSRIQDPRLGLRAPSDSTEPELLKKEGYGALLEKIQENMKTLIEDNKVFKQKIEKIEARNPEVEKKRKAHEDQTKVKKPKK